jgi:phage-related tail protein
MTSREAKKAINDQIRHLEKCLDSARSQFAVRLCYMNAHDDMVTIARNIAEQLPKEES